MKILLADMKSKAVQVFEYLLAVKRLSSPVVRNISDYGYPLWWQAELPLIEGCFLSGEQANSESWLEVHKQNIVSPPEPPRQLKDWLDFNWEKPEAKPLFKSYLPKILEQEEKEKFTDDPKRVELKEKWLGKWLPWAETSLPKYKIQEFYGKLFNLYQTLQREADVLELVWGHAFLTCKIEGTTIRRPVCTTRLELKFDERSGVFSLQPAGKGTVMETDMFTSLPIPNAEQITKLEREIQEDSLDVWDADAVEEQAKRLIHYLSSDGRVHFAKLTSNPNISEVPVIYNAPVIFVRKITGLQWENELKNIITLIKEEDYPVPETITSLITTDGVPMDENTRADWVPVGEELLFPLSSNEEQKEIARRLTANYGVCVQGPPGTGKSHTIANLICHLLAHGKKVLVTSQTERALKVLSEKIPDTIRPLCVSVLGGDSRSVKEIEDSIQKISDQMCTNEPAALLSKVKKLQEELKNCRNNIAELRYLIKQAAEREHLETNIIGRAMEPASVAKWLTENQDECGWLTDQIPPEAESPLTDQEMVRFWHLAGILTAADLEAIAQVWPDTTRLPGASVFRELIAGIKELEIAVAKGLALRNGWLINDDKLNFEALISQAGRAIANLENFQADWLKIILNDICSGGVSREIWSKMHDECTSLVEKIMRLDMQVSSHMINITSGKAPADLLDDLKVCGEHLAKKNKFGFFFKHSKLKYILEQCTVDEHFPRSIDDINLLTAYVEKNSLTKQLVLRWNNTVNFAAGEAVTETDPRVIINISDRLAKIKLALDWQQEVIEPMSDMLTSVTIPVTPSWTDPSWYRRMMDTFTSFLNEIELNRLYKQTEELKEYLEKGIAETKAHPIWHHFLNSVQNRDVDGWLSGMEEMQRLSALQPLQREYVALREKIEPIVPRWVGEILAQGGKGEILTPPANWQQAWNWSRLSSWLQRLAAMPGIEEIETDLQEKQKTEKKLLQEIISLSTWARQLERITDRQKRSLMAWIEAVRKIGKGKGKYANRHRKNASKEMEVCQGAIPVWIMPINRVIENIKLTNELFDVVIVDESSQCTIFSLVALLRAKKAVIVGDEHQISPEAVGSDQSEVNELISRHLSGIPHAEWFDLQTSLYHTALRVFPGKLMLKEHFRCVPEIIQFSNDLMYGGEIEPLRLPKIAEILDPPVRTVRITDGWRSEGNRPTNEPEAMALVDVVVKCCSDKVYENKTMGVISLLGMHQTNLIEEMLRNELGEIEMIRRKIICGDAYSFQGDERDVMFLSLVIANNVRFAALVKRSDEQRFNVAASRAKDQMWLFHSVDLDDINPNCVRSRLLRYCLDPGLTVRQEQEVEHLFESGFERDVYRFITARGYAVRPQVKVGRHGKRIDLVVEGLRNRLAVECDGDKWHGLEQWEADFNRQQVLERAGWIFWRVRGSIFYRHPQKAMQPLWIKLNEMGIMPSLTPKGL